MSEPDWSKLPHDARAFFELPDDFDRKTLKRAYNRWIRMYKPEKHPQEFQKIRAAFEQLENELRYGILAPTYSPGEAEYQWSDDSNESASADSSGAVRKTETVRSIRERLKSESAKAIYLELKEQTGKSPYDFFALAVLSDVLSAEGKLYFQWLLMGLKEHRFDPGLLSLVRDYLRRDHDAETLRRLLLMTSKTITDDRYYYLTEKSWLNLLRQVPFEVFRKTLKVCESNLRDHRNDSQLVFYAEVLKAAIWTADDVWVNQQMKMLGEAGVDSGRLDYELYVLETLRDYLDSAQQMTDGGPIKQRIHETIVVFFTSDDSDADAAVITCQNQLASDGQALLNAFPLHEEADEYQGLIGVWSLINEEVSQRHDISLSFHGTTKKAKQELLVRTQRLIRDLSQSWSLGTIDDWAVIGARMGGGLFTVCALTALAAVARWLFGVGEWSALIAVAIVAGVLLQIVLIDPKVIMPMVQRYVVSRIRNGYRTHWRGRFLPFFDATGVSFHEALNVLSAVAESNRDEDRTAAWLSSLISTDLGLYFYSFAAQFRR